jgi:hypothetical protein
VASIDYNDPLKGQFPEAQFVVRVRARESFQQLPALHPQDATR